MKIGIVQPLVGQIGGNDTVLLQEIKALQHHDLTLFTFGKPLKDYGIPNVSVTPIKIPLFGIYQNLFMPKHDYSEMDLIIGNSVIPNTDKPLIIYDQNHMANDFTNKLSDKYSSGFWKLYSIPYRFLRRFKKTNYNARYYSCSYYSAEALQHAIGKKCDVLYPSVNLEGIQNKPKKKQICVMGRLSPEKNLINTIKILNGTKYPCVIAGNVTDTMYLSTLKKLAKKHITFMENPSRDEFLGIMSESKIYFTSSRETFGITTIEAIASGCIPILPDNSAHPETVPFPELRYNIGHDAVRKSEKMMESEYDIIPLQLHIRQFNHDNFARLLEATL